MTQVRHRGICRICEVQNRAPVPTQFAIARENAGVVAGTVPASNWRDENDDTIGLHRRAGVCRRMHWAHGAL